MKNSIIAKHMKHLTNIIRRLAAAGGPAGEAGVCLYVGPTSYRRRVHLWFTGSVDGATGGRRRKLANAWPWILSQFCGVA